MKRLSGYPNWFHHLLLVVAVVVAVTGLLMLPTLLEFKLDWEVVWRLSGEQRLAVAAMHTLLSWLLLMQVGALWHAHMRAGWRKRLNRISGVATVAMILGLTLSAAGLFYLGSDEAQLAAALIHSGFGVSVIGLFAFHVLKGRRINSERQASNVHYHVRSHGEAEQNQKRSVRMQVMD